MLNIRGAALALLLVLPAVGAKAQSWTDWTQIAAGDSYLQLSIPPGGISPEQIELLGSHMPGKGHKRELWTWETGMMHMYVLKHAQMQKSNRKDLMGTIAQWPDLQDLGLDTSTKVHRGNNILGNYYYAELPAQNADLHCFIFLQNLRINVRSGYQASPDAAGGLITGFDCQNEDSVPFEQHAELMKSYIKGLRRQ